MQPFLFWPESVKWNSRILFPEFTFGSVAPSGSCSLGGGRGTVGAAGPASRGPGHHRSSPSPGGLGDLGIRWDGKLGVKSGAGPGACFLSDRSGLGRDSWGPRSCSCRAFEGPSGSSSRRQNRTADRSCSKFMDSWQVRDEKVVSDQALQSASSPLNGLPPLGLRARMASLRQGCGDLRGLVSSFTQSCQGSLSEAQGQVRTPPRLVHFL